MRKKQKFLKVIAVLVIVCIFGALSYFVYDKTDFVKPTYSISLNLNGGKCDTEELTVKRKASVDLPTPTKPGYDFLGWYYGDTKITDTSTIRENITLTARWKAWTFDITFIVDGVSKVVSSSYGSYPSYGETPTKASTPIFVYEFKEWQPALEPVTKEATYTAIFEEKLLQYTVIYDAAGGNCSLTTVQAYPNQYISLPTPTYEGHRFLGWYYGNKEWTTTTPVTCDMTIVAKWEVLKFNIKFVVEGNETEKVLEWGTYPNYGSVPIKPSTNYAEYKFLKWQPALEVATEDKTYTAVFEENIRYYPLTVYMNYQGACTLTGAGDCTYQEHRTLSITNIKPGYEFEGWFVDDTLYSKNLTLDFVMTKAVTLHAKFKLLTGTISYDLGVAGLDIENPNPTTYTVLDGSIELESLERKGYEMLGWYSSGTKYTTIDCSVIADYNLKAFWKISTYSITYDLDGGEIVGSNPASYTIENVDITLINPTKQDFEFVGWIGTDLTQPTKNVKILSGSVGNRSYTAVWKSLLNTVLFSVDDVVLADKTMYLDSATATTEPLIDSMSYDMCGYVVDGWYTDNNCTIPYTFGSTINTDLTLYGRWRYSIGEGFYNSLPKFKTANTTTAINIDSFEELVAYVDYVSFYEISDANIINITYKTLSSKNDIILEIERTYDVTIYPNNSIIYYNSYNKTASNQDGCIYIGEARSSVECTYTADLDKSGVCAQLDSANFVNLQSTRLQTFDDFSINNVKKTLEVQTSNQLVYALECGLRPICKVGSKAEMVYNKAKAVLRNICDDNMTHLEKARAIYEWIVINCEYDNDAINSYNIMNNWWLYDSWFAEGVFNNEVAVCDGFAKAYLIMARIEGIPTVRVNSTDHAWNKICIEDEWYGVDTTHGNIIIGGNYEILSYTAFMFTDDFKESEGYYADNYTHLVADTEFNYYSYADYDESNTDIDLYITSESDLKLLLNCFKDYEITTTYLTIEIAVDRNFTDFDEYDISYYSGLPFSCRAVSQFTDSLGNDIYLLYVS